MSLVMLHGADVMHVENVDPRQTEPLQTVLERPHDPVVGIVILRRERHRMPSFLWPARPDTRSKQATGFCRQHPFVARRPPHRVSHAAFGLAEAVKRRRIDIAHPRHPGGSHDGFSLLTADRDATPAKRRTAEAQRRNFQRGSPDLPLLESRHRASCEYVSTTRAAS